MSSKADNHKVEACKKVNCALGMISRTIKYKRKSVLLSLYRTLVRPHLEYCTPVWSPHYAKDKHMLEKVQHRFTRIVPCMKEIKNYYRPIRTDYSSWVFGHRRKEKTEQIY